MNDDGDTINLRKPDRRDPEFVIESVDSARPLGRVEAAALTAESFGDSGEAQDRVKVKFEKFVNLIASHAFEDVIEKHANQEIIISTDLLTDLANAQEEKPGVKWPVVLVLGIVLGVAFAWYFLS